ncbi:MAG: hypothetical protein PHO92_05005, partial [Candidatus Peribacteraceae bacterium]|nr:hypothetical protein [Candidatus Peribacteraceae bacterium]
MALRRFRFTALLLGGILVAVVALQGAFQNRQQAGEAFHAQVDYGWDAPVYDDEPAWTDDGYSQDETWSDNDGYQEGAVVSDDDVYYFQDDPVWPDEPWEEPSYPDEPLEEQDTLSSDGESGCTGWCGVPDDCPGACYPSEFLECKYSGWYWYCDFKDDGSGSSEDDQGDNCEQPNYNTQGCDESSPDDSSDMPDPDCPADCSTYCDPPGHCVVDDDPNETGVCCQLIHSETGGAEQTGLCAITTQEICAGSLHAWVGGDDCSVCGGGDPGIVCCQPDGSCQITRSDFCTGTPGPGQTCVPNPCIPESDPKVPCCFGTVCIQDVQRSLCEGPTCESGVCPNNEVACCVGGSPWTQSVCTVVTGECASPAGGSTCYAGACGVGGNCDGEGGRDPPCTIGYRCTTMGTCVWVGIESSASSSPFPPVVQPPDIEEPGPIMPLRSAAMRTDPNVILQYTSTIQMDIDGNGVANAADAVILNNYLNGKRGSGLLEGTGRSSGWQSWAQRFLASLFAQQGYRSPQEMEAFIAAYLSTFDL